MNAADLHEQIHFYLLSDAVLIPLALLSWWLVRRFVHARLVPKPTSLEQPLAAKLGHGVLWGAVAAIAVVLLIWAGSAVFSAASGPSYSYPMAAGAASAVLLWSFFAAQALFEELLFRALGVGLLALLLFWLGGLLFAPQLEPAKQQFTRRLWLVSGLLANLIVAVSFAVAHNGNPHFTPLAGANIALAGLVLGQLYWLQGAPWGAWGWHCFWNGSLASLGQPVSGVLLTPTLVGASFGAARADFWSGGRFGPEGSLACTIVLVLYLGWLLRLSLRHIPQYGEVPTGAS